MQAIGLCLTGSELPPELPALPAVVWENPAHAAIWAAICALHRDGHRLLSAQLIASATGRELEEQGRASLVKHLDRCAALAPFAVPALTGTALAEVAGEIRRLSGRRQLKALSAEMATLLDDPSLSAPDVLARVERDLSLLRIGEGLAPTSLRQLVVGLAEALDQPSTVMSTGIDVLDEIWIGGMWTGKLYGIAARMKVGKTVGLTTIARNVARAGHRVLYLALEMGQAEIAQRAIAAALGCNSMHFLRREDPHMPSRLVGYALRRDAPELDNLLFRDCPGCTFDQLRSITQTAVAKHEVKLLVLDYWQLVQGTPKGQTEAQHLGTVAQWLADFARRSGVAVLTAAQINRDGHTRGSDGLRLACDWYGHMHPVGDRDRWIEALDSRYAMRADGGSEASPPLYIDNVGPMLREHRHR